MKVKEIMTREIKFLSPEDYVSKLIPMIEKNHLREIIIVEDGIFKGIVYSKDIAEMGIRNPTKTKISSLLENAPTVSSDQQIEEAANVMFNSNLRVLPVIENKKVAGILLMPEIVNAVTDLEIFKKTKAREIMSAADSIADEEDIGRARILMREKGFSRLPVIDNNKKLVGIVTIFDLLKAVKPMQRINFYSMAGEKEKVTGIKISSIMNKTPIVVEKNSSLSEIAKLMMKNRIDGVIITEKEKPIGVISMKDLLESYVYSLGTKGVFYQIVGIDKDDDSFVLATVERMIADTLTKVSKLFEPQFFIVHVKKYNKKGKVKYSIRARLKTSKKIFISKSYAWDLRDAVNAALDKLERVVIKEKMTYRSKKEQILKFKKFSG